MGKQFSFYLTVNDLVALQAKILEARELSIFAEDSPHAVPLELPSIAISEMGKENLTIYLARPSDRSKIRLEQVENRSIWVIDVLFSPVIELSRCYFDSKILRRGRMYFTTGYYLESGAWTDKNVEFLEWADNIFRIAKKSLTRNRSLDSYLGEEAKTLFEANKIKLADL